MSQCTSLKSCYRKMRLVEEKFNSVHNSWDKEKDRGRQGTKLEGQEGQEVCDKKNKRGQQHGSKDAMSKDLGCTAHLRNMGTIKEARKE